MSNRDWWEREWVKRISAHLDGDILEIFFIHEYLVVDISMEIEYKAYYKYYSKDEVAINCDSAVKVKVNIETKFLYFCPLQTNHQKSKMVCNAWTFISLCLVVMGSKFDHLSMEKSQNKPLILKHAVTNIEAVAGADSIIHELK